jgi:energy-converting hydrogenase Eha subunit G
MNTTSTLLFLQIMYGFACLYLFSISWILGLIMAVIGLFLIITISEKLK